MIAYENGVPRRRTSFPSEYLRRSPLGAEGSVTSGVRAIMELMPSRAYQHESGPWCRAGVAADAYVVGERATYDRLRIVQGDVVLDLGAHIGVVARHVLDRGAAHVVAVEPYAPNVRILRLNLSTHDQSRYTIVAAAAVGPDHTSEYADLLVPAENFAMCSLVHHGAPYAVPTGRRKVAAVQFDMLLASHRPTVLKVDIEAGEFAFVGSLVNLPRHVRCVAIEWHNFDPHLQDGRFYQVYSDSHTKLLASGYALVHTSGMMVELQHSAVLHIYDRDAI